MTNHKYRCPVCGAKIFEVTHYPDEADIWSCANCDFSAEGKSFLVNTHS